MDSPVKEGKEPQIKLEMEEEIKLLTEPDELGVREPVNLGGPVKQVLKRNPAQNNLSTNQLTKDEIAALCETKNEAPGPVADLLKEEVKTVKNDSKQQISSVN